MRGPMLMSKEEADKLLSRRFAQCNKDFAFGWITSDKRVFPCIETEEGFVKLDKDGGLRWSARVDVIGLHAFLFITVKRRVLTVPICLVEPRSRRFAWSIAETTKVERYNEKKAEMLLKKGEDAYPFWFDAGPLCTTLVVMELMPSVFSFYRHPRCPACGDNPRILLDLEAEK